MNDSSNPANREFVDRCDELAVFTDIIDSIRGKSNEKQESVTHRVVNFVGVHGIGKSLLLHKIVEVCTQEHIMIVLVDFVERELRQESSKRAITSRILRQFEFSVIAPEVCGASFHQYFELRKLLDSGTETPGELTPQIETGLKGLLQFTLEQDRYCPVVIALDTVELAPQYILDWIEDLALSLWGAGNLVLLAAGRVALKWKSLETKRLTMNVPLEPFGLDDVKAQAMALGVDVSNLSIVPTVYRLLGGYPKGSEHVLQQLNSFMHETTTEPSQVANLERTAVQDVAKDLIMHHVPETERDLWVVIELLATVRQFDLNSMNDLVLALAPCCFEETEDRDRKCLEIIAKIHRSRLVTWNAKGRYQLDHMVRRLLAASLRINNQQRFLDAHRAAMEIWERTMSEVNEVEQCGLLVELLFHYATILRAENINDKDLVTKLQDQIQHQMNKRKRPAESLHAYWSQLFQYLKHDGEIESIVGKGYATLINYVAISMTQAGRTSSPCRLTITKQGEAYTVCFSGGGETSEIEREITVPDTLRTEIVNSFHDIVTKLNYAYSQHEQGMQIREDVYSAQIRQLQELGSLMFGLYLPAEVQDELAATRLPIVVETNDGSLPWELMSDGSDYLSFRIPMSRHLKEGYTLRKPVRYTPTGKLNVLLIANPTENLTTAEEEALRIQEILDSVGASIDILVGSKATSLSILERLRSGKYNVIHYSGHAVFNPRKPSESYLVCANSDPLYAGHIGTILQGTPLVFLNSCYSGAIASTDSQTHIGTLHEGIIASFLRRGAIACIGAQWEVYDKLASELAVQFHRSIIDGHPIGEALRIARVRTREKDAHSITPLAFAMYGDPNLRPFTR